MMPAPRLLAGLAAWVLLALIVAFGWLPLALWIAAGGALLAVAAIDALAVLRAPAIEVERVLPGALALGRSSEIGLRLRGAGKRSWQIWVHDHHPGGWPVEGLPRRLDLKPGREIDVAYRLRPVQRGTARFEGCMVRLLSPLGFWLRQRRAGPCDEVRVYPDFAPLARFALISAERVGLATGAHMQRRRGEGTDFHQLREFRIGDSLRQVDWKATARLKRPISRQYQDERDQQIIVALDTGRCMLARDDELAHFDHALNAVLVLAYIALRQGDAVGLLTSGNEQRWLPPQRGGAAINTLMNSLYDVEARPAPTDFLALASALASRQRRRALVVLVSNLRDEDSDEIAAAAALLGRRHLVCVASLREKALDRALDEPPADFDDALLAGGVARYLAMRRRCHDRLRQTGATVLDVNCDALPKGLTETYLAIKRSGRL